MITMSNSVESMLKFCSESSFFQIYVISQEQWLDLVRRFRSSLHQIQYVNDDNGRRLLAARITWLETEYVESEWSFSLFFSLYRLPLPIVCYSPSQLACIAKSMGLCVYRRALVITIHTEICMLRRFIFVQYTNGLITTSSAIYAVFNFRVCVILCTISLVGWQLTGNLLAGWIVCISPNAALRYIFL